jgi:hypothetical protein
MEDAAPRDSVTAAGAGGGAGITYRAYALEIMERGIYL